MKKKYVLLGILAIFIIVTVIRNINIQKSTAEKAKKNLNEYYMECLYMSGECIYKWNRVEVKNKKLTNSSQLYIDVAFYNLKNSENEMCVDDLLNEYDNFCKNEGTWQKLELFCAFENGDGKYPGEYKLFDGYISSYLIIDMNIQFNQATTEQLEQAVDYVLEKYY